MRRLLELQCVCMCVCVCVCVCVCDRQIDRRTGILLISQSLLSTQSIPYGIVRGNVS